MGFVGLFQLCLTESILANYNTPLLSMQHATTDFSEKNNEGIVDFIDQNDLTHLGWSHVRLCVLSDSISSFIKYVMSRVGL